MKDFIRRALKKSDKLTAEQLKSLLETAAEEIGRLETVLNSLDEGVLVCDQSHRLTMANKYAERCLLSAQEAPGVSVWTLVRDERTAEFLENTLRLNSHIEEKEIDVEINGINRLLSFSILPLVQDKKVSGSLIYFEDITEKRSREARLHRAENLASLTTLAAGVAHEIKNPLGAISIHIQLMQKAMAKNRELFTNAHPDGTDGIGQRPVSTFDVLDKYIDVVNEEVVRLNRIVVDFLFAVRPMDIEPREGSINSIIAELVEFVGPELEQSHITCVLELAENIPRLRLDERFMKQALLNLIKNAQAAMGDSGVLTIRTEEKGGEVLVSICDTGVGISEDNISKIFEPYFTTKETGSGLGLTLVFKIIKEHQGEISVKSREGKASGFNISLPVPQKERRLRVYEASDGGLQ
ncbi:MAG: PAS domain-containing protein [Treponema sp.]|nr:PAS domain-containing protein [Treponema sp.]